MAHVLNDPETDDKLRRCRQPSQLAITHARPLPTQTSQFDDHDAAIGHAALLKVRKSSHG